MKKKIFSICAVLLICVCSLFMFAGCEGLSDLESEKKYGKLVLANQTTVLTINYKVNQFNDPEDYFGKLQFTYTPPQKDDGSYKKFNFIERVNGKNETKTYSAAITKGYGQMRLNGLAFSSMDFSEMKSGDKPRVVTFSFRGTSVKMEYRINRIK